MAESAVKGAGTTFTPMQPDAHCTSRVVVRPQLLRTDTRPAAAAIPKRLTIYNLDTSLTPRSRQPSTKHPLLRHAQWACVRFLLRA
jgi:hypothetical protein